MTYAALGGVGGIIGGKMAYNAWQNHKANEAWKKAGGDDMPTAVGDGSQEGFTAGRSDGAPPA